MFFNGSSSISGKNNYIFNEKVLKITIGTTSNLSIFSKFRRIVGLTSKQLEKSGLATKYKSIKNKKSSIFINNLPKNIEFYTKKLIYSKFKFLTYNITGNTELLNSEFWCNNNYQPIWTKIITNSTELNNTLLAKKLKLILKLQKLLNYLVSTEYFIYFFKIIQREVGNMLSTNLLSFIIKSLKVKQFRNQKLEKFSAIEFNKELIEIFYFNNILKSVYFGNKQINTLSNLWLGSEFWNFKKDDKLPKIITLCNLCIKILSKSYFKSTERISLAVISLGNRDYKYGFCYKNSITKLNQSWGNLGSFYKINYNFKHYNKNINVSENKEFILNNDLIQQKLNNDFKSESENLISRIEKSFLVFPETESSVSSINIFSNLNEIDSSDSELSTLSNLNEFDINPVYSNWVKAGYIVFSDKFSNKRVLKMSGIRLNYNTIFDSKVFGHPFHLVNPSVLPLTLSFVFFTLIQDLLSSFWLEMWYSNIFSVISHASMVGMFFSVILTWVFEIYSEEQGGFHTLEVQNGFRYAILLFILSELMLFISFFWAYFHFSLNSNSFTGGSYTPKGLVPFYSFRIPLLNTLLLLASGLSLTVAHTLIIESDRLIKILIWIDTLSSKIISDLFNFWNDIIGGFVAEDFSGDYEDKNYFITSEQFYKRLVQLSSKLGLYKKGGLSVSMFGIDSYSNSLDKVGRLSNDFQINIPKSYIINFKSLQKNTIWQPNYWILDTVLKGFVFLIFQAYEYTSCMFSMNDGVYGAVFFSLTGLHGIHVFLGVMFLLFALLVNLKKNISVTYSESENNYYKDMNIFWGRGVFTKNSLNYKIWTHRIAFDGAAWYWHFVDVVWFFVFVFVYWWGFSA